MLSEIEMEALILNTIRLRKMKHQACNAGKPG